MLPVLVTSAQLIKGVRDGRSSLGDIVPCSLFALACHIAEVHCSVCLLGSGKIVLLVCGWLFYKAHTQLAID